jgi:CheY-like chemotaxis protein
VYDQIKSYGEVLATLGSAPSFQDYLAMGHLRKNACIRSFSSGGSAVKEQRRILIVDDDQESTHLIKILLEKIGRYFVLEENDAAKAHQSARNFGPDLILLDIMMPQRDGGDIAAEIDADPGLQRTPIVFLTAMVTKAEAKAGLQIQGHPVLAKPINIPELINRIEENLPAHDA